MYINIIHHSDSRCVHVRTMHHMMCRLCISDHDNSKMFVIEFNSRTRTPRKQGTGPGGPGQPSRDHGLVSQAGLPRLG